MLKNREPRRSLNGAQKGFQVERRASRGSRKFRHSSCGTSPVTPCAGPMPGAQARVPSANEVWLGAWEDRLRLREDVLEKQGIPFHRFRATPVLDIVCKNCDQLLSDKGMQAYYKNQPEVDIYSTNEQPKSAMVGSRVPHHMCGCRVRELQCRCGDCVGYFMEKRCANCDRQTDEDDGHDFLFEFESVNAKPRLMDNGEVMMWPGWEFENGDSSIAESPCTNGADENCLMPRMDGQKAAWNFSSPLADRNGRPQAIISKLTGEDAQGREASREKQLRDATAQKNSTGKELATRAEALNAREEELTAREHAIRNAQEHLEDLERQLLQASKAEETGTKQALQAAELKVLTSEAEAEGLRAQLSEQQRINSVSEDKLAAQAQEIQQLQASLTEVRQEVRKSVSGAGRLPPADESSREELKKRVDMLGKEVTAERVELASVRSELKQAHLRLESKDAELEHTLIALSTERARTPGSTGGQRPVPPVPNYAEVVRLRSERDAALKELDELRPELERLRNEAPRHATSTGATSSSAARAEPDEFVEARLNVAQKLAEKRVLLERREKAVADREAALQQGMGADQRFAHASGGQPIQMPAWHGAGGSGLPQSSGFFGLFDRFSCARRQGYPGYCQ